MLAEPSQEDELRELIDGVRSGEPRAVTRFFYRYEATVNRLVWRLLGADAAHDDVVSVTFETMLRRIGEVRAPTSLEGWVRAVTVNATRMELRRRRWRRLVPRSLEADEDLDHPDLSVPDEGQRERLRALYRALGRLGDEDRQMLVLRHLEGLELTEVDTGRTWRYHVGPWLVVRGTRLSLRYAPELGELEVSVSEGAVEVTGPGGPARVAQGQTLRRSVDATSRPQGPGLAPPSLGPTPTLAMPHPHSKKLRPAPETRHDAGAPWASASWLELLDLGQRAAALDEAEHQGVWARLELRGPSAPSPRPTRAERTPHTNTSPWGPRLGAPRTRGTRDGPRPRALIHLLLRDDAAMHPEPAAREGLVERPRQRLARHRVHPELDELLRPPRQAGRIEPHDGPLLHHPVVHGEHEDLPRPLQLDASRRVTQQHAHSVRAHGAHPSATGRGWLQCVSERTRS